MVLLAGRLRGTQRKMPTHLLFLFGRIAERLKRLPFQLNSSQVVFRFALRLALLSMFATFGTQGFAKTFAALLALSVIFCVVMGTMRREGLFGPVLTHWDEAAAYAVIGRLVSVLS